MISPTMKLNDNKSVLIFNRLKRFAAFCPSVNYAAELAGTTAALVSKVCHGYSDAIKAKNHYFRFGGLEDIEDAKKGLVEYDRIHGINARYYPDGKMSRKSLRLKWKWQKHRTPITQHSRFMPACEK